MAVSKAESATFICGLRGLLAISDALLRAAPCCIPQYSTVQSGVQCLAILNMKKQRRCGETHYVSDFGNVTFALRMSDQSTSAKALLTFGHVWAVIILNSSFINNIVRWFKTNDARHVFRAAEWCWTDDSIHNMCKAYGGRKWKATCSGRCSNCSCAQKGTRRRIHRS